MSSGVLQVCTTEQQRSLCVHITLKRLAGMQFLRRLVANSAWHVNLPQYQRKLTPSLVSVSHLRLFTTGGTSYPDLYEAAVRLIDDSKRLPTIEADAALLQAGVLLETACANGDGRACTRLGRWQLFGVANRLVNHEQAWGLFARGWTEANDPEAAYWMGWICQNGNSSPVQSEGGCGRPGGCGCASSPAKPLEGCDM